ncbi:MAG TPA: dTDP-4-dehydrorhamnose reductase [Candidatus Kapabacteria bacterium]|nr:dTDP-4-dehydrorhamnose reductase [Candidatus Kapabacteria bacterium]
MKVIIFGAKGQLGSEFCNNFAKNNIAYLAYDYSDFDINNYNLTQQTIAEFRPDVVINCSAYTLVENAENDTIIAYSTNSLAPSYLAILSKQYNFKLVHFSTDYVFDGSKSELYIESDFANPLNIYGKSKLLGENQIVNISDNYLIFRLSWVYGNGQNNFIAKLGVWSQKSKHLKIADDEISIPTSVKQIVEISTLAINQNLTGLFHLTNSGYASRFEWANELNTILHLGLYLERAKTSDFKSIVQRPLFSAMSNKKLSDTLDISIVDWREDLRTYFSNFK